MRKLLGLVLLVLALVLTLATAPSRADEGMWTYNAFPKERLAKAYGFTPDDAWLEHMRLASVRLAGGCSGSFVSAEGLVMTNHHCVHDCVQDVSTAAKDYVAHGFLAKTRADEIACPALEINQLVEITDVTERMTKAMAGVADAKYYELLEVEKSRIEKECAKDDASVRCDVVSLYHGGIYNLYRYKRYQDVRVVFAPELATAFFGGDPENFNFPRFDLDVSFVRVYEKGAPLKVEHWFKWAKTGVKNGDLTFVSGHPGSTQRLLTVAQLEYERDVRLANSLLRTAELRGVLTEFQRRGAEAKRVSTDTLFYIENSYKANRGRAETLRDKAFMAEREAEERDLRDRVAKDPKLAKKVGGSWDAIAKALVEQKKIRLRHAMLAKGNGFEADLFYIARDLLRAGDERPRANDKRLPEYSDAALPALTQSLFSPAPLDDDLEIVLLTFGLTKLREELGARDPLVRKVLGKDSPETVARRLVSGTKLKDVAERKRLWEGGKKAVAASKDPMIVLARMVDAEARALRKHYEDKVESVIIKHTELIARARFALDGTSRYPDATFSLRLNYGTVKGWEEQGSQVKPFTTFAGAFELHTGQDPYALPASWLAAKKKLKLGKPLNFVTTNDIIGGNSGSPVLNKNAEIVGLAFDSNIHGLGGAYRFDAELNRTVSVSAEGILHALDVIYDADALVKELTQR